MVTVTSVHGDCINWQVDSALCYYGAFDYWGTGTTVTVSSATPAKPTVFPLMPCGSGTGNMVTLGCLATGFTPSALTFTWNKNGAALADSIQYPSVLKGDLYTGVSQIQVRRQDWEASTEVNPFKCVAKHSAGNGDASISKPVIVYTKPTMKVSSFSREQNEVSFICTATDFSPKDHQIKWRKNGVEITAQISEFNSDNATHYSVASILKLQSSEVPAMTEIRCEFKWKNKNEVFNDTLIYNPAEPNPTKGCPEADVDISIKGPKMDEILPQKTGTITCHVKVNKPTVGRIYWENHNGDEIAGASMEPAKSESTYSLPLGITFDEWSQGIKFNCVVEHSDLIEPIRTSYERKMGGSTKRPSVFMMPPVEHIQISMVTLTCYVKDFYPEEVFVSWLVDDELTTENFNTTNPIENGGTYSAYGQLTLPLKQWKDEGEVYSCVVYHQSLVSNTKAIVRSIGYNTHEKLNLVNLSLNIPDTCKPQ